MNGTYFSVHFESMKYHLTLFFLVHSFAAVSQNIYSSPYSVYGPGIINNRLSTLNRGMGGAGIAVRDGFNLNYVNPASYTSIAAPLTSIFEMGLYIQRDGYTTNQLTESKTNGNLTNINYWFKPSTRWASIAGLTPFSSVSYKINSTRSLGSIPEVDYQFEGTGNISQLYWGNSFSITRNLSAGINISYLFGTISRTESIETFDQASNLTYEERININKAHIDVGLQYAVSLKKDRSLVVGVIAEDGITFKANGKSFLYDAASDTLAKTTGQKSQYYIPSRVGLGLALHAPRSIVAADLDWQSWSSLKSEDQSTVFIDTWKFSLGYMYRGNPDATTYAGAMSLRAGLHIQDYYLQIKQNTLPWWGLTAGVSVPMFDNRSSINITYAFDQLGTLEDGLILQRSQSIMIDVIVRDVWGMRRKFD